MVFISRPSIGPLSPFLKEEFYLSNFQGGSLVSAAAFLYIPTLVFGGWMVDRVGVRRMLAGGMLITSFCITDLYKVSSYKAMLLVLMFSGLGTGCIFPSAVKAIVLWSPLREGSTLEAGTFGTAIFWRLDIFSPANVAA
jgi:ACS family D-galactonate transporter-like MFS transporter